MVNYVFLYRQKSKTDFSICRTDRVWLTALRCSYVSVEHSIRHQILSSFLLSRVLYHRGQVLQCMSSTAVSVPARLVYTIASATFVNTSSDLSSKQHLIKCGYCSHFSSPTSLSDGPVSYTTGEEIISARRK